MTQRVFKQVEEFCHGKTKISSSITEPAFASWSQTMTYKVCCPPISENTGLAYSPFKAFQTSAGISPLSTSFPAGLRVSEAHECTCGMKNESPRALSHAETASPNQEKCGVDTPASLCHRGIEKLRRSMNRTM